MKLEAKNLTLRPTSKIEVDETGHVVVENVHFAEDSALSITEDEKPAQD